VKIADVNVIFNTRIFKLIIMPTLIHITDVQIQLDHTSLEGCLNMPENAKALAIFLNENDNNRFDLKIKYIARELNQHGITTLLVDLLAIQEKKEYENRFNIRALSRRLVKVSLWAMQQPKLRFLAIGFFGAGMGAAIVLQAALIAGHRIKAIVCLDGLPDLAREALPFIKAPVLFMVGSLDNRIACLNNYAYSMLHCEKEIAIIKSGLNLFNEQTTQAAELTSAWFTKELNTS